MSHQGNYTIERCKAKSPYLGLIVLFVTTSLGCTRPGVSPVKEQSSDAMAYDYGRAYWHEELRRDPLWASYLGERNHDSRLPDWSAQGRASKRLASQSLLAGLRRIRGSTLSPQASLIVDVLTIRLERRLKTARCQGWSWVVDQLSGPQVWLAEIPNYHRVDSLRRAQDLLGRYEAIPKLLNQHIANLRQGMTMGRVAARINVSRVIDQLQETLRSSIEASPFVKPVLAGLDPRKRDLPKDFESLLKSRVQNQVYGAYSRYLDFLKNELLPLARTRVGLREIPGGAACYQAHIEASTGQHLSANEIHGIGLREVKRINGQMSALVKQMGGTNIETFLLELAERKDQKLADRKTLLNHNRRLVQRAQTKLSGTFGRLPGTKLVVRPIERFRERDAPAAYYYPAPSDGSRPATYYLNTHEPSSRLVYKMAALTFHEAVPGHHLQRAIATQNANLPAYLRHGGEAAFVEGWALYAEKLAHEMGLYETKEERLGALTYEMWRAVRLVVDTGLHARGWSRDRAIDYMALHTGHDPGEVVNEIDRYIAWPGQALAYKLGEMEFSRLRRDVQDMLGDGFDIRAFHDQILRHGAIPMKLLRREILRWLGREDTKAKG